MPIRENEGKWTRSSSLRDSTAKKAHPLNFKFRAVASHHIISCEALNKLSTARQDQIIKKGYNVNHQKNLVILPMNDQIACQYNMPLHKSNHTDSDIIQQYQERTGEEKVDDLTNVDLIDKNTVSDIGMLTNDISSLNVLTGYHKVIARKLALGLKQINCDTKPKLYIGIIDDVATEILGEIASFDLLLISKGKDVEDIDVGCSICQKNKIRKTHWKTKQQTQFKFDKKIPKKSEVESFSFLGEERIRLLNIREQINIIKG
ncbi:hypothetical protein GNP80_20420 [Aliivibrio fischeri]|uniref:AHH domain-containing protein n=1 Tax=Aliivibrio fischeri TaxID=668 RepID=UPI0007C53266|nr:AHH domain-containing protein [Aliivibrio fischeri]MUK94779.1 hypothetical protein [Aliivibrio fischeri]